MDASTKTAPPLLPSLEPPVSIAVDFDGVLFDQIPHLIDGFQELHGLDVSDVEAWPWNLSNHPSVAAANLEDDQVWEVFGWVERQHERHKAGLLDEDARSVLQAWTDAGHTVDIVSSRRPASRATAERFLEQNDIPHRELNVDVFPKTGYDVLIDDLPPNVEAAADDGSIALLYDRPYNRAFQADGNPRRVDSWARIQTVLSPLLRP